MGDSGVVIGVRGRGFGVARVEDRLEEALGEVWRDTEALGQGPAVGEERALPGRIDKGEVMPALRDKELGDERPAARDDLEDGPIERVDSSPLFQEIAICEGLLGHPGILAACSGALRAIYRLIR